MSKNFLQMIEIKDLQKNFALYGTFHPCMYSLTIDDDCVDDISFSHMDVIPGNTSELLQLLFMNSSLIFIRTYPCTNIHNLVSTPIPPYVGSDYFCDTASESHFQYRFYPNDPLWDDQGCGRLNTCCSFNNPPWFMKELPSSTSDDIEMRLCADSPRTDEDINFESIELYVQ